MRTGRPLRATAGPEQQTETYDSAWRTWRDLASDVQAAVTAFATEQGSARNGVEEDEKAGARSRPGRKRAALCHRTLSAYQRTVTDTSPR